MNKKRTLDPIRAAECSAAHELFLAKKKELKLSQRSIAEAAGITPPAVNLYFKGINPLNTAFAAVLAEQLQVDVEQFSPRLAKEMAQIAKAVTPPVGQADGAPSEPNRLSNADYLGPLDVWDDSTPLEDDEVYVPFLKEVELSAGSGRSAVQQSTNRKLRFGKITLRQQGVEPANAVCVTVSGNSMEPVLPNGATVGVDQGSTTVIDGKMYALDHAGELRVKTVYRIPGGGIRLRSFNRDEHPDEEYSRDDMANQNIAILGRVFWSSALW